MQIQNLQEQKIALGKAYMKSYAELFSAYITKLNDQNQTEPKEVQADNFYKNQKELENAYETEKYKLNIQEAPSIHTMIAAVNYKQKLMIDDMNAELKEAYQELKSKLKSGRYTLAERTKLREEYKDLKDRLRANLSTEMSRFRASYYDALVSKNISKIDNMEQSLLSNLLSKS